MLNYRQSNVIERETFVDSFEVENAKVENTTFISSEEKAFNSKIADNFDRIINYDSYNMTDAVKERVETVQSFVSGVNYDVSPSSTTMQYKDMPKAEIYQDYRVEASYYSQTKIRPRAKVAVAMLTLIVLILTALVILNTTLLGNLNNVIDGKMAEIEELRQEQLSLEDVLNDVSSDQTVIDKALEIGMKG